MGADGMTKPDTYCMNCGKPSGGRKFCNTPCGNQYRYRHGSGAGRKRQVHQPRVAEQAAACTHALVMYRNYTGCIPCRHEKNRAEYKVNKRWIIGAM